MISKIKYSVASICFPTLEGTATFFSLPMSSSLLSPPLFSLPSVPSFLRPSTMGRLRPASQLGGLWGSAQAPPADPGEDWPNAFWFKIPHLLRLIAACSVVEPRLKGVCKGKLEIVIPFWTDKVIGVPTSPNFGGRVP